MSLRFELRATKQIQERVEYASSKAWQWTTDEEWILLPNPHEVRGLCILGGVMEKDEHGRAQVSGSGGRVGTEATVSRVKRMGRTRACQSYLLFIIQSRYKVQTVRIFDNAGYEVLNHPRANILQIISHV